MLSAGSFYPELFVGYMGGRHLGSLGCIRASARLVPGDMGQSLSPVEAVKATANGEKGRRLAESRVPDPGGSEGLSGFSIVDGQATMMKKKTSGIEDPIGWSGFSVNVGSERGYFPDLVDANNGIHSHGRCRFQADLVSTPVARSSSAQSMLTPATRFLGLISSSDPAGNIKSVPIPTLSTGSLRLISFGSDFGSLVLSVGSSMSAGLQDSAIPSLVPVWSKAGGRRRRQRLAIQEAVSPSALFASTRPTPEQISDSTFSGWIPVTISSCLSLLCLYLGNFVVRFSFLSEE